MITYLPAPGIWPGVKVLSVLNPGGRAFETAEKSGLYGANKFSSGVQHCAKAHLAMIKWQSTKRMLKLERICKWRFRVLLKVGCDNSVLTRKSYFFSIFGGMEKIAILTSGGDAPGMNACVRAVVRSCLHYGKQAFGVYYGYQGLIDNDIQPLANSDVRFIIDKGGTMLYSARCKQFLEPQFRKQAFENLQAHNIDGLIVIGGDGSFKGAQVFSEEFNMPVMGIPGTIDNDIAGTDVTLGYDTASNTAMQAIDKIRDTATSHNRLFLVEVMGRDAGDIALRCGLAVGAIATFLPERTGEFDDLLKKLNAAKRSKKRSNIVVVAEGEKSGGAVQLAERINQQLPEYETRVTILGHLQRGGSPTVFDREFAARTGVKAVEALLEGESNCMVGMQNGEMVLVPLEKAITEKAHLQQEKIRMLEILSNV